MNAAGSVVHIRPKEGDEDPGWSLVETRIGEAIGFMPTLRCFPRAWRDSPPAWSGEGPMQDVRVESAALSARFDARVAADQERNWLLQLLSPEFITWLCEDAQEQFGFELHEGMLRCFSPGLLEGEAAARLHAESSRVGERVRSEALESEGLGVRELGSGTSEAVERRIAEVAYPALPADSKLASKPFRGDAARSPRPYVVALGGIVSLFTAIVVVLAQFDDVAFDIAAAVASLLGPKNTGLGLVMLAFVGWVAAIPEAINLHARTWGRPAFAREYAAARGLTLESPQSFHRRLMRVDLPAPAEFVFRGALDGRREGRLVLCRSRRRVLSSHSNAAVFEFPGPNAVGAHVGLSIAVDGGSLVVTESAHADRSVAELDRFSERAVSALDAVESGSATLTPTESEAPAVDQRSTSSTSPSGS